MSTAEQLSLTDHIKKIKSLRITQLREFDSILSELTNYLHDLEEAISENHKKIRSMDPAKKRPQLLAILKIQLKLDELSELLWQIGYENHYMDRCIDTLGSVNQTVEKVIEELKE
jgi:cobalamin biosynthesis Mg chelatase CobN